MSQLAEVEARLRAAVERCGTHPQGLHRNVLRALSLLETARRAGHGHLRAIDEALAVLGEVERHAIESATQQHLFAGRTSA